jgi:hypothetical protein
MTRFLSKLFGATRTARAARPAAKARLGLESLDGRELMSASPLNWTAPSGNGPNAIVLQVSGSDVQVLDNGNVVADQAVADTSSVAVTGGSNNTFTVAGTAAGIPTTITTGATKDIVNVQACAGPLNVVGNGWDTVNVGNNGSVKGITGVLTITNPPSWTTINVDDSADATARTVTVGNGPTGYGLIHGLASADITFKYADTASVSVSTGTGGNTVNVPATMVPTSLVGHGRDTVSVGNNGSVQGISGALNITNPPSFTTINVDDSADATARTVTVGNGATTGSGLIHGLAPADITFKYADTASVSVSTGTGGNTVNVPATMVPTSLIGHGRDTVSVGNNGSVQGISGALNITNPPSFTTINVNDSADTATRHATLAQATINGDSHWETLSGLAPASINYYDFDIFSVAILLDGTSSVAVQTDGGVYTTVNGQLR